MDQKWFKDEGIKSYTQVNPLVMLLVNAFKDVDSFGVHFHSFFLK